MADLDDLFAQIPTEDIARTLGVDVGEVDNTIRTLVPVLVGGVHESAQNPDNAGGIENAAGDHAARGLLDGNVDVDQIDQADGGAAVASIFGGNDTAQVASALSGAGAGNNELVQKLLPILTPIVLAYIGKHLGQNKASGDQQGSGGGLGDVLGSILSGATGTGNKAGSQSMGSILGTIIGNKTGGAIGDLLGGLFGGKK